MAKKIPATDRFAAAAASQGLTVEVIRYPEQTRTAQQAADALGCTVDQIVKSLIFLADGQPVIVLTSGAHRVDTGRLAVALNAEIGRADAAAVRAATGFAIGGVPPLGHPTKLRTLIDPHLSTFERIWAAAGTPDSVFPTTADELTTLTGATTADVFT